MSSKLESVNLEWKFVPIGRGSFATVSVLSGRPVAFKQVIVPERAPELKLEFEMLQRIYDVCNADPFFAIPRPLACFDPARPENFVSSSSLPVSKCRSQGSYPVVALNDFSALQLNSATYAMDQVLPLPLTTSRIIRKLFYPRNHQMAPPPSLCRLYFGRVIDKSPSVARPNPFFNSANFPLDVMRYRHMLEDLGADSLYYPTVDDIAYGMGQMLGRLHWLGGYDGRDVEFVMGGASFSGIAMYIIDFNQVRPWSKRKDEVDCLVDAFFLNDPYYPRPRSQDSLYQKFRCGYLEAYLPDDSEAVEIAEAFLSAIETKQAKRDFAVQDS